MVICLVKCSLVNYLSISVILLNIFIVLFSMCNYELGAFLIFEFKLAEKGKLICLYLKKNILKAVALK